MPVTPGVQHPTPPVRCTGDRVCVGQVSQAAPVTAVSQATTISTLVAVNVSEHCVLLNNIFYFIDILGLVYMSSREGEISGGTNCQIVLSK